METCALLGGVRTLFLLMPHSIRGIARWECGHSPVLCLVTKLPLGNASCEAPALRPCPVPFAPNPATHQSVIDENLEK